MPVTRYRPESRAIVADDLPGVCNRPLFCANGPTAVLAGDRPVVRIIRYRALLGTLRLWVGAGKERLYLDEFEHIRFEYRANLVTWTLRDARVRASITLEVGVPEDAEGFVLRAVADAPATVSWEYAGLTEFPGQWNLHAGQDAAIRSPEVDPAWIEGCVTAPGIRLSRGELAVYVASNDMTAHYGLERVCGTSLLSEQPLYIGAARAPLGDLAAAFASAHARSARLAGIFRSDTPDPWLDTQLAALSPEIDGAWYPPRTVHSNQSWNMPYLGWCNRFGHSLGGWVDRARDELAYYVARMNRSDLLQGGQADPERLLTESARSSRLYGLGHIEEDQSFYNMQSQFFDQAIFAWRMTGDAEIEALLRDALELHTRWQDECFDPDGDGLYESYINTWPTDSVWYNGGGSCEETCYAFRAHEAAYEIALRAGDNAAAARHAEALARIRDGFRGSLWIRESGYPAMFIENGGHGRVHRSAWLYNCFLPVDVGLAERFDAASALDYSRWGLENVPEPAGGRTVWLSNWVPGLWSVRENAAGENFQLAYAYFKAGFAEDGYALLTGALRRDGFVSRVIDDGYRFGQPGNICSEAASLLARAVVCGLHGYRPDYPNGSLLLAPQYPAEWDRAALSVPYFTCSFRRSADRLHYRFKLDREADVTVRLPIYAERVAEVTGAESWTLDAGFGCRVLVCRLKASSGELDVRVEAPFAPIPPLDADCAPGETLTLGEYETAVVRDPQGILAASSCEDGKAVCRIRDDVDGNHMLILGCARGDAVFWRIARLRVSPTAAALEDAARSRVEREGRSFEPLDISAKLNADVRDVFRQEYLSPRHGCVHCAIGTDGYSPWTFTHWANPVPDVRFDCAGRVVSAAGGLPFRLGAETRNIAFTSLWDNWPDSVTVPVGTSAEAIELLVCGTSNPMQCGIANAVLRFEYEDGDTDTLELVHPDNYWTLAAYTCHPSDPTQMTINDYDYETDAYCLPAEPPETIQLGVNCRAVVVGRRLLPKPLRAVTLETLSQEVVVGLMAATLVHT